MLLGDPAFILIPILKLCCTRTAWPADAILIDNRWPRTKRQIRHPFDTLCTVILKTNDKQFNYHEAQSCTASAATYHDGSDKLIYLQTTPQPVLPGPVLL